METTDDEYKTEFVLAYVPVDLFETMTFGELYDLAVILDQFAADQFVGSVPTGYQPRLPL